MEIFKSSKKDLILAISTKEDGNMRELVNKKKFANALGFSVLKFNEQVHKNKVVRVNLKSKKQKADGLITNSKEICLGVVIADCLPIYLYNEKEIALIHCGWRGLSLNILGKTISKMDKKKLKALIGPGILKCHFKVKQDLLKTFPENIFNKNYIDLQAVAEKQLTLSGVKKNNIKKIRECTFCSNKYFSFRKKNKQAMMAIIGYKKI